jgi:CO dehydrogenase/acetyl-CoA synthase gamma subunit (corrinoid Fe-S protein)
MSILLKRGSEAERQAGFVALVELRKPYVERFMVYSGRTIPVVSTRLSPADRWGSVKARWGVGRMSYSVLPGLYAVGAPGADSDVFVSANYKMSFDALRSSLAGLDAWILALDTKGINVWCAAGKGSFGTKELISRIASTKLAGIVRHRRLVLPQLGATGVCAPEVAQRSGFHVEWGPVRAADIKAWLAAGRRKDEAMREITFNLGQRMAVAPVELVHAWPAIPGALALAALYGLPFGPEYLARAVPVAVILLGTVPIGTVLFPALLPYLPSKAFVVKGAVLGAAWAILSALLFKMSAMAAISCAFLAIPAVAFLAMNFTGSSTYTCQQGALMEVDRSFWPMAASLVASLVAGSATRIFGL